MAETHELRLKIDAAAAKSGSRDFTAAISAVKRAVRDLERDSEGAFKRLNKNIKDAAAVGKMKMGGVDKQSIRDLNDFARAQAQVIKNTSVSQKGLNGLIQTVRGLTDSYAIAKRTNDAFAASILKTNSALNRQIQLASQARSAVRQARTAPTPTSAPAASVGAVVRASTPRAGGGADTVVAQQAAIQRALEASRLSSERLTTSLMKVGGFSAMSDMQRAVSGFQRELKSGEISTKRLAAAKMQLDTAFIKARTSLTTLTAKTREQARAEAEAANATKRTADINLASTAAMRRAEAEAARLIARMHAMGDTRGVARLTQSLVHLKSEMKYGVRDAESLRNVMLTFAAATNTAKTAITQTGAAQARAAQDARRYASEQNSAAAASRRAEREMRSIAGATNASSSAWRSATGNMRGLENAFSGTFQAGTLFRNMLGSLTLGVFASNVYKAGDALDQFRVTMEVATGSTQGAAQEMDYVDRLATSLGTSLQSARDNYSKFAISADIAGVSTEKTRKIFESISTAMSVLGKGTEDQNLAFMALEQMMSKGCHAPGSLIRMADGSVCVVEDIRPGDELMGPDGLPRTVIALAHGREEMFRVIPTGGTPFVVNRHHKLRVYRNGVAETLVLNDYLTDPDRDELTLIHSQRGAVAFTTESVGDGEFHGFLISDDHLYLDADGYEHHNTVSSEELRRQLGERLPGAVNMMAQALGVTTAQLQDMLKAGEISSADALPKFADLVMEKFGPGLEAATKRAGFNLGTLRNEITKLLEVTAQSGLMQVLAREFRNLTNALNSDKGREAAAKIGQGMAMMADVAGDAIVFVIDNLETLGQVMKAVAAGIIVRQVLLMGKAFATSAQNFAGFSASFMAGIRNWMSGSTAVTAHSAALTANSAALTANGAASGKAAAATAAMAVAQERAVRAALVGNTQVGRLTRTAGGLSSAFSGLATGMAWAARALGAFAPVVGLVVTAVMVLPALFGDTANAAEEMAGDIESAIRRAGVSFEDFGETVKDTTSMIALNNLLNDLQTLDGSLAAFKAKHGSTIADGFAGISQGLAGQVQNGPLMFDSDEQNALQSIGIKEADFDKLSGASRGVIADIMELANEAVNTESGFVNLYESINKAMMESPGTTAILAPLNDWMQGLALAEVATTRNRDKLVELFGTPSERLVQSFAQVAAGMVDSGKGMEALNQMITTARAETPELVATMEDLKSKALEFAAGGRTSHSFLQDAQNAYDQMADKIEAARAAEVVANQKAAASVDVLAAEYQKIGQQMLDIGVPRDARRQVEGLVESLYGFKDAVVPMEQVRVLFESMEFPTAEAEAFTDAVRRQYASLDPAEQTYDRLRQTMDEVAQSMGYTGAEANTFINSLAGVVREGRVTGITAEDLRAGMDAIFRQFGVTSEGALDLADSLADNADEHTALQRAAAAARGEVAGIVGTFYDAQAAAYANAEGVDAATAAYGRLQAAKAGLEKESTSALEEMREQNTINAMPEGPDRDIATYFSSNGEGGKIIARAQAEIDGIRTQMDQAIAAYGPTDPRVTKLYDEQNALQGMIEQYKASASASIREGDETKWEAPKKGPKGKKEKTQAELQKEMREDLEERLRSLEEESIALKLVADGTYKTMEAAEAAAEQQLAFKDYTDLSTDAMLRQIDATGALNDKLQDLAKNQAMTWGDVAKTIRDESFGTIRQAMSDLIVDGFTDWETFGDTIERMMADVVTEKAMSELGTFMDNMGAKISGMGGIGGVLSSFGIGGGGEADMSEAASLEVASTTAGANISSAFLQAGATVAQQLQAAMTQGGTQMGAQVTSSGAAAGAQMGAQVTTSGIVSASQMGTQVTSSGGSAAAQMQAAITAGGGAAAAQMGAAAGGGGGGGGEGGLGQWGGVALSAGLMLASSFLNRDKDDDEEEDKPQYEYAQSYAIGTANTSGIPAILHDNEAVIPLTGNRKVPVELEGGKGAGGTKIVNQTFNITTQDADSFRRSQKQIAADAASAGQNAMNSNR